MHRTTVLIVDDSSESREILSRNLGNHGYSVMTANNARSGIELMEHYPVSIVITDLMMPEIDGLEFIRFIRENFPNVAILMVTGYASIPGAVEAIKTGAEEYLSKPFTEDELISAVKRSAEKIARLGSSPKGEGEEESFRGMIGRSRAIREIFDTIRQVAPTPASVMILGESGTGKEMAARAIHYESPRAAEPFVCINCGAIPENLLESELFGYVKGAFTGAETSRAGFFQTADRGTIFLDEVSETSPAMQVKLLRVLQEREFTMVGSAKPISVDIRILSASNYDLEKLVEKGLFREDLYYRLNVVSIRVPALRDRGDDAILLARMLAEKYTEAFGRESITFSPNVEQAFLDYSWPGNVRELENVIQRLVIMTNTSIIDLPDLPDNLKHTLPAQKMFPRTLAEVEKKHIEAIMQITGKNKTQAARILGIDRKTLREKLKRLGLTE